MNKPLDQQSIIDPELIQCPYGYYAQLHAEAPVHRDPATGFFIVAGYQDMQAVIKDTQTYSNNLYLIDKAPRPVPEEVRRIFAEDAYPRPQCLQRNDPPEHARFRRLVDRAFTASRVRELTPYIDEIVAMLIDGMIASGPEVDFVRDFAVPLPCIVIADQIGVPRADVPKLKRWSDALLDPIGLLITPEREIECAREVVEFQTYFAARIEERRAAPRDDILTALVGSMTQDEDPLTTPELLNLMEQLLTGGNDTTTSTLAGAMQLLVEHPDQQAMLRADPALIGNFVEEALRVETPVQGLFRQTTCDTALSGVPIPAQSIVMLRHGAVNRDPHKFDDPDRFDVRRRNAGAHLAFGAGTHFCPGAMLARQEINSAFRQLLERIEDFAFIEGRTRFTQKPSFFLRGLQSLHLRITPRRQTAIAAD